MSQSLPFFNRNIEHKGNLETKRLSLEPLCERHLPQLTKIMFKDKDVMEHVYSLEHAIKLQPEYIKHWKEYGFGYYTLFHKETGKLVGRAGIFIAEDPREIELGYSITKALWGQGYATEAAEACLQHGFEIVGAKLITATVVPENKPSVNVAGKLGMAREGKSSYEGKENDIYVIRREEYLSHVA